MRLCALAAVSLAGSTAAADVIYDNITSNPMTVTSVPPGTDEFAQNTSMAPGANLALASIELWLRNVSSTMTYNAPVWIGLYTESGGAPGTLFAERTQMVQVGPGQSGVYGFDFSGVTLPSATIWTSFRFADQSPSILGIGSDQYPTVGSTTGWSARRIFGQGQWTMSGPTGDSFAFRFNSIPAPATLLPLLMGVRRRR